MNRVERKVVTKKRPTGSLARSAAKPEPNVLRSKLKPDEAPKARQAELMVEGLAMNALVGVAFATKLGDLDLTECFAQVLVNAEKTSNGDSKSQESILAAQIISTNAIYTDLALLARANLDKGLNVFERLMRLALKAQSNCRATAETLAFVQNPPAVFAKQANISSGPQQVNNGVPPPSRVAREEIGSVPIKLLEANGERLDTETPRTSVDRDKELAALGTVNRPQNRGR